ncbi:tRNA pseudouridine(13) synthase TruD [Geoglobus acetivorans]|uniref:Probable tRNA pseudouridine synthase D n=1 Tax=Geoglobus acetivorans TaxID=565033 RepID=A0ABZ3H4Q3_GEOAI|nr:tRNA pseudouridine(13) synthase TruD [Geoglobus acetivorans]
MSRSTLSLERIEELAGIRGYITSLPGIGGKIKEREENFEVREIINIKTGESGRYLIIKVRKKNWDTLNFVRVLSNILHISRKRIEFAGTKDKKALTVQYFSISKPDEKIVERLSGLKIKDAEVEVVGFSDRPVKLGDLTGNEFRIVIDDVDNTSRIDEIKEELQSKGIPNFFGLQRFGTMRLITHEVGRHIIRREYEAAFWTYVAKPSDLEDDDLRKIREDLWNERDPATGIRELPKFLVYERSLLQKLIETGSELKALLSLPKNLKLMFVHAYQSYLFNHLLSSRIEEFGSLRDVGDGDWADYRKNENGFVLNREEFSRVMEFNIRRVSFLLQNGFAFLSLPLPGYETQPEGWCGEKLAELLEKEGVGLEDFRGDYPEFSSRGSYRVAEIPFDFENLKIDIGESKLIFEFFLPKGCFATSFLREFMKSEYPYFLQKG